MIIIRRLQSIIEEFKQSTPQSEAEIRSKLIVPLLDYLGYPSVLRAEEFPVYGFEGRKRLPTKEADYVLFTDTDYANHRSFDQESISWVQAHSLLVAEAKKTGEMPGVLGQPQYYTVWTRAIAYFVTDGITFRGCLYQPLTSDYEVVSCYVEDLPKEKNLFHFTYDYLSEIKQENTRNECEITNGVLEVKNGTLIESDMYNGAERIVFPDEEINLPKDVISSMKNALGKNAEGIDDYNTVKKYLSMTDSYLENDIRYNTPEYMIQIPRKTRKATLHINGQIVPSLDGEVTIYYQNEKECYEFENDILSLFLVYESDTHVYLSAKYICNNHDVRERLRELNTILSIFTADKIDIWIQEYDNKTVSADKKAMKQIKKEKESIIYWIEEINKLDAIQKHFGIHFYLSPINNPKDSAILYNNVDIVYKSINMQVNMFAKGDRSKLLGNVVIDKPYKMKEEDADFLEGKEIKIHNYLFIPHEVYIMPSRILKRRKGIIPIELCVTFTVQKINENG